MMDKGKKVRSEQWLFATSRGKKIQIKFAD